VDMALGLSRIAESYPLRSVKTRSAPTHRALRPAVLCSASQSMQIADKG
jgi:hypothetical protein